MRTPAAHVMPVLGSLALHASAISLLVVFARRPLASIPAPAERTAAWAGSAVEVDALAAPLGVPTLPNAESSPSTAAKAATEAPSEPLKTVAALASGFVKAVPGPRPGPPTAVHRPPPNVGSAGSARDSTASNASPGSAQLGAQAGTGAFGSQDLPPGVRSLPSAFTRAIPPATAADPIWQALPSGREQPFTIAVQIDAAGRIRDSKILEERPGSQLPEQFSHLRERVVALLGAGLFALQNDVAAGSGVFRITITLSDRAIKEEAEPAELVERGFVPPHASEPGRAYFTLASGRHFEAKVEIQRSERAR